MLGFLPACHGDHSNACPLPPWLTHRYFNHVLEGREKQRQARDLRFVSRCIVHAAIDVDVPGNFNGGYSRCVGGFRTETTFDQKFLNRFLSEMVLQRFNGIFHKISSDGFLTSHKTRQEQCSDKLASDFIPWVRRMLVASITQSRFNDGTIVDSVSDRPCSALLCLNSSNNFAISSTTSTIVSSGFLSLSRKAAPNDLHSLKCVCSSCRSITDPKNAHASRRWFSALSVKNHPSRSSNCGKNAICGPLGFLVPSLF
jgi:hypothetical protein